MGPAEGGTGSCAKDWIAGRAVSTEGTASNDIGVWKSAVATTQGVG